MMKQKKERPGGHDDCSRLRRVHVREGEPCFRGAVRREPSLPLLRKVFPEQVREKEKVPSPTKKEKEKSWRRGETHS